MEGGSKKLLWDLAISHTNENPVAGGAEASVLVAGMKNSGKTSMILRFLDRDEAPKSTTALEYTFARRSKGHNAAKDVGHVWELGGGPWHTTLLDVPITAETISTMSVILVVDLTRPREIWVTIEKLLASIRERVDAAISDARYKDSDIKEKLRKKAWDRIGVEHEDRDFIDPLLIPLAIIGGKYDAFRDMDPEKRKVISKCLRFLAHVNGASILYFSSKDESLVNKSRSVMSSMVFGTASGKAFQFEHSKPIFVMSGQDSFKQIGTPPVDDRELGRMKSRNPTELWKSAFISHFPQDISSDPSRVDDPARDPQFKEPTIDSLRKQKDEELERYRRQCERRARDAAQQRDATAY